MYVCMYVCMYFKINLSIRTMFMFIWIYIDTVFHVTLEQGVLNAKVGTTARCIFSYAFAGNVSTWV